MFSSLLGKYTGVELLDHRIAVSFSIRAIARHYAQVILIGSIFPLAKYDVEHIFMNVLAIVSIFFCWMYVQAICLFFFHWVLVFYNWFTKHHYVILIYISWIFHPCLWLIVSVPQKYLLMRTSFKVWVSSINQFSFLLWFVLLFPF